MPLDKAVEDFVFLSGYDLLKMRKIPSMDDFIVNAVNSVGYEYLLEPGMKMLNQRFFKIPESMVYNTIIKMLGISVGEGLTKTWVMGKASPLLARDSIMKGVLAVGAQSIFKNL